MADLDESAVAPNNGTTRKGNILPGDIVVHRPGSRPVNDN
jgi:hypothetical protein